MYRHDVISTFVNEVSNDMNNVFLARWKDAEAAGEASENEDFVKMFTKGASKEMMKWGWTKNPVKDVILEHGELGADDKAIFKLHVYGMMNDNRSWARTSFLEEGTFKEKMRSVCFEEAAKLFRKQELTAKPEQPAA